MAEIDIALDDLAKMINRRGSGGKRPAPRIIDEPLTSNRTGTGSGRRRFADGGSWRNGSIGFGGGGNTRFRGPKRGGMQVQRNNDEPVWINIANLPETVVTADLQDLFEDFNVQGLSVHYNELGQHMGTADLFVDARSAQAILREYGNIAIDGQKIRFAILDQQIGNRVPQLRDVSGRAPVRPRRKRPFATVDGRPRSNSGQSTRTYSRSRSPFKNTPGGRGRGKKDTNTNAGNRTQQAKSTDELDRELEAYMKGNKHPRIT